MCKENLIDFDKYAIFEDGKIFINHWNRFLDGTVNKDGYLRVSLKCKDNNYRVFLVHRLVYFYFNGEIPEDMEVNHIDENKMNNTKENLNLLSHKDNCNWGTRNERISKAMKGRKVSSGMTGHKHSEESKKKISVKRKGIPSTNKTTVYQYKNGELVAVYSSITEAAKSTGYGLSSIAYAVNGNLNKEGNHKLKGYEWFKGIL